MNLSKHKNICLESGSGTASECKSQLTTVLTMLIVFVMDFVWWLHFHLHLTCSFLAVLLDCEIPHKKLKQFKHSKNGGSGIPGTKKNLHCVNFAANLFVPGILMEHGTCSNQFHVPPVNHHDIDLNVLNNEHTKGRAVKDSFATPTEKTHSVIKHLICCPTL